MWHSVLGHNSDAFLCFLYNIVCPQSFLQQGKVTNPLADGEVVFIG